MGVPDGRTYVNRENSKR